MDDWLTRGAILIVSVGFLAAYVAWRWRRAGAYVDAMNAHRARGSQNFEALRRHPLFQQMWPRLVERHGATDASPDGPGRYQLVWLALLDDQATCYRAEDASRATMLVAYLQRQQAPAQLQVAMRLDTGELSETVPPYGWVLQGPEY